MLKASGASSQSAVQAVCAVLPHCVSMLLLLLLLLLRAGLGMLRACLPPLRSQSASSTEHARLPALPLPAGRTVMA